MIIISKRKYLSFLKIQSLIIKKCYYYLKKYTGLILSGEIDKAITKEIEKILSKNKKIELWAERLISALADVFAEACFCRSHIDSFSI